jgi:uncharacterized membrane protein YbhN (UPF0104 family)
MIRVLVRLAVAAVVLGWLASRVDLAAVGRALAATSPTAIVLATVAAFASNAVIAFRLTAILASQGVVVRASETFVINLSAYFYNLFLPVGGVGIAALRLQRLSTQKRGRFTAALTAMVCDRLAAVVSLGMLGLACWLADARPKPAGSFVVLCGGVAVIVLLLAPRAVPTAARTFVRELQVGGHGTWWAAAIGRLRHALGAVARLPTETLARIVLISIVAQIPGVLVYVVLGQALGMPVASFVTLGWVRSVVMLVTVLPLSIGGLGVREGMLLLTLGGFGVPAHESVALSILIFATTILAPGFAGGVVEAVLWLRGTRVGGPDRFTDTP